MTAVVYVYYMQVLGDSTLCCIVQNCHVIEMGVEPWSSNSGWTSDNRVIRTLGVDLVPGGPLAARDL